MSLESIVLEWIGLGSRLHDDRDLFSCASTRVLVAAVAQFYLRITAGEVERVESGFYSFPSSPSFHVWPDLTVRSQPAQSGPVDARDLFIFRFVTWIASNWVSPFASWNSCSYSRHSGESSHLDSLHSYPLLLYLFWTRRWHSSRRWRWRTGRGQCLLFPRHMSDTHLSRCLFYPFYRLLD